jgi:hypothetical protein
MWYYPYTFGYYGYPWYASYGWWPTYGYYGYPVGFWP